jgi:hypothetical protein
VTRVFSRYASRFAREQLRALVDSRGDVGAYRFAMQNLGQALGVVLSHQLEGPGHVILASTVEDADYLARGALYALERNRRAKVSMACFWNDRTTVGRSRPVEQAPILRQYVEPHPSRVHALVMLKSIISTACVVRTNLVQLLEGTRPARIIVAAPVMYFDARRSLEREFPRALSEKFEYVYFARDSVRRRDGTVVPGVGGSVYELLGLGSASAKNRIAPALVVRRRAAIAGEDQDART